MDKLIVFIAVSLMPTLASLFFLLRVGLFFYISKKETGKSDLFTSSILPLQVLIPIKKSTTMSPDERKVVSIANLMLYFLLFSCVIGFSVGLYGRKHDLLLVFLQNKFF